MTAAVAVLLLESGSCSSEAATAVLVSVLFAGALALTCTWILKLVDLPAPRLPTWQVRVPVGACVQLSVSLRYTVALGRVSVTTTLKAAAGPLFVTFMV